MLALLSLGLFSCQEDSPPLTPIAPTPHIERPNILMVVMDTTRQDALGVYGNALPTSPNFDQLSSLGMLYTNAWSTAPWTWPAHASMFTGLYPWEHGAHFTEAKEGAFLLDPDPLLVSSYVKDTKTLADELNELGYETIAISANRLIGPTFPLTQGFSHSEYQKDDSVVWESVEKVLAQKREKPLFLFVNLMSAHAPWFRNNVPWIKKYGNELNPQSSPPWLQGYLLANGVGIHPYLSKEGSNMIFRHISGVETLEAPQLQFLEDMYWGEVSRADKYLGLITKAWQVQNPEAKMIITADHGEYFGEHGFLEHGRTIYPEVISVPLLVLGNEIGKENKPVSTKDVFCTVLDFAKAPKKNCGLLNPKDEVYAGAWADVYWTNKLGKEFSKGYRAAISETQMLIADSEDGCELVDLKDNSVQKCHSHGMESLFKNGKTGASVEADEETLRALEKLGYIGQD